MGEHRRLTGAGARYHQHGPVDMLNSLALAIIGNEGRSAGSRLRGRH